MRRYRRIVRLARFLAKYWSALARYHAYETFSYMERAAFVGAVGNITIAWASIELQLDYINLVIIHHCESKKKKTPVPVSLNPKIAFFRRSFQTLPQLKTLKDEALGLIDKIDRLKMARHSLVHGYPIRFSPLGKSELIRVRYSGQGLFWYQVSWHFLDLVDTIKDIRKTTNELHQFVRKLDAIFHPHKNKLR